MAKSLSCAEIQQLIPFLLDDELGAPEVLEITAHLRTCVACSAVMANEGRLRSILRQASAASSAPASLRRRFYEIVQKERPRQPAWLKIWPLALALAIALSFFWRPKWDVNSDLDELAQRHARAAPMEVVASDSQQLQSYFQGKLGFVLNVPKFPAQSMVKKVSGSVIRIGDQNAAYLRYEMPSGVVSVLVHSAAAAELERPDARRTLIQKVRGYCAAQWRQAGLAYAAVTNLTEGEMADFLLVFSSN